MTLGRPTSATERAYHQTRAKILDGILAGGDVITEGQVSTALGISRTPVREAFLRLQAEGLLQLYPKRGAVVVPVSEEESAAVIEAREIIESFAATKILTENDPVPPDLVEAVWGHLAEQQLALRAGDFPRFLDADAAFHLVLVAACENPFLRDLFVSLRDHQRRHGMQSARPRSERMESSYSEHTVLAEQIERGDLDAFLAHLRSHLRGGRTRLGPASRR